MTENQAHTDTRTSAEAGNRFGGSVRSRSNISNVALVALGGLVFAAGGSVFLVVFIYYMLGYAPPTLVGISPRTGGVAIIAFILAALIALAGVFVLRITRQAVGHRVSIRTRLTASHLVAVTASTFVYAFGGFLLLVLVLYLSGYTLRGMIQLVPEFIGVTILVLIQIGLITLCGMVVARVMSQVVSAPMLQQIGELEEGSNAIAAGQLTRHVAVLTDDELGRLAGRFNVLTSRLRAADNQRRAFVANISHDLRTPIAVIRGYLDAQRDTDGADDLPPQASFAAIEHEVATLSRLIDDLFTMSRLEEGVLPVVAVAVDLAAVASEAVVGLRSYALKTGRVSLHAQIEEELPQVVGDPTRITQVINNLLHNAVRHTPEGGLVVLQARSETGGGWVEVTVRDTGVGIPPDVLGRIFDRYYQGETIGEKGGAGLGLSIVKQLVEMQGGTVRAESTVGEGTSVTFRLPAAPSGRGIP